MWAIVCVVFWVVPPLCFGGPVSSDADGSINITSWQPRLLGSTKLKFAAFTEAYFNEDESLDYVDRWTLYVSTFNPVNGILGLNDKVYYLRGPGNYINDMDNFHLDQMDQSSHWPNNPDYMPSSAVGVEGIVWSSGFLVPGSMHGQLQMYDTSKDPPAGGVNIASLDENNWSYHKTIFKDMDNDGDLDAVSARFHVRTIGEPLHDFVWFENENRGMVEGWKQHVIATDGPDVSFWPVTLTSFGKDYDAFLVGEFWSQKLSLYWTENEDNDWSHLNSVKKRVIDPAAGQVFDVIVYDFNQDGVIELACTSFHEDLGYGEVYVYKVPEDFKEGEFERKTMASNFVPNDVNGGGMSPGNIKPFSPSKAYSEELEDDGMPHKSWFLLSGDDSGTMFIMTPNSTDRSDWAYDRHVLTYTGADIIGKMTFGDFDGDGYTEIVVAYYSEGKVFYYTYAPE